MIFAESARFPASARSQQRRRAKPAPSGAGTKPVPEKENTKNSARRTRYKQSAKKTPVRSRLLEATASSTRKVRTKVKSATKSAAVVRPGARQRGSNRKAAPRAITATAGIQATSRASDTSPSSGAVVPSSFKKQARRPEPDSTRAKQLTKQRQLRQQIESSTLANRTGKLGLIKGSARRLSGGPRRQRLSTPRRQEGSSPRDWLEDPKSRTRYVQAMSKLMISSPSGGGANSPVAAATRIAKVSINTPAARRAVARRFAEVSHIAETEHSEQHEHQQPEMSPEEARQLQLQADGEVAKLMQQAQLSAGNATPSAFSPMRCSSPAIVLMSSTPSPSSECSLRQSSADPVARSLSCQSDVSSHQVIRALCADDEPFGFLDAQNEAGKYGEAGPGEEDDSITPINFVAVLD